MSQEHAVEGLAVRPADDWWRASDGKWYPPESDPDFSAFPPPPVFSRRPARSTHTEVPAQAVHFLWAMLASGALILAAGLLPWVTIEEFSSKDSLAGFELDAFSLWPLLLGAGIVISAIIQLANPGRLSKPRMPPGLIPGLLTTGICLAVVIWGIDSWAEIERLDPDTISPGAGLYLTAVGGIAAAVFGTWSWSLARCEDRQ